MPEQQIQPILSSIDHYSPGAIEALSTVYNHRMLFDVREQAEHFADEVNRGEVQYLDVERAKKVLGL